MPKGSGRGRRGAKPSDQQGQGQNNRGRRGERQVRGSPASRLMPTAERPGPSGQRRVSQASTTQWSAGSSFLTRPSTRMSPTAFQIFHDSMTSQRSEAGRDEELQLRPEYMTKRRASAPSTPVADTQGNDSADISGGGSKTLPSGLKIVVKRRVSKAAEVPIRPRPEADRLGRDRGDAGTQMFRCSPVQRDQEREASVGANQPDADADHTE